MEPNSIARARQFVEAAAIDAAIESPRAGRDLTRDAADTASVAFETAKDQAAVVGSDVVAFVRGVTAERRDAIVNSSLLAQLVAKKQVPDASRVDDWYNAYFDVLTNIGWVVQDRSFAEYHTSGQNFEAHQAILAVAATLLGAAPTALALVTSAVNALHSMDDGTPWVTVFKRESQTAHTARFQISLVEQEADGPFFVTLMAFALAAKSTITQVLFFKARKDEATLRHSSGRVTIDTDVLDAVRGDIKAKLIGATSSYVHALPNFGAA